jgi:hypothetical protein
LIERKDEMYRALHQGIRPGLAGPGKACACVSGVADPLNGRIDEFRISHVPRSDPWIATTWNNMSDPAAFAAAGAEGREGGEPPPLAGAGVVICLMG